MKDDIHFSSRMMMFSGSLMTLSGVLMALCGRLAIGGCFWAGAACIFLSAYYFRLAENKKENKENKEETYHDQETL